METGFLSIKKKTIQKTSHNIYAYDSQVQGFAWPQLYGDMDWLPQGGLNAAHECIDKHILGGFRDKVAMIWVGKNGEEERYTYNDMKEQSDRVAAGLKSLGIQKGDRVFLFLERVPELYVVFFGILKIGAIAGPLFSAFGPDPVKDRLENSGAVALITQPDLRSKIASILPELPDLQHIIVVNKGGRFAEPLVDNDIAFEKIIEEGEQEFIIEPTTMADYSVMHYTSGTTGKPKGAVHRHLSVLQQYATGKWALDLRPEDIYWCTADPGWVTGTSYGMFAPWSNGVTQLIFEGGFNASRWYKIIQDYGVTVWYTAPTAIRMLMKAGDSLPGDFNLSSLRFTASVGEPLNPEAVVWSHRVLGQPFHDNWWQTETGAILIANFASEDIKPGSMGKPTPGVVAAILDDNYDELPSGIDGNLAIRSEWPSMFQAYWEQRNRYTSRFMKGWYISGDRAHRDADGYFWFVGRTDDVINTAGHLVGPFEVESALVEHPAVAEAGVIGKPDAIAMEIVKAFVSLKDGYVPSDDLRRDINRFVRQKLSAGIAPREIEFLDSLPKTRSGKIMRRLLKARELGLPEGDTSTLEDD
jgi:acetyl-CoA synthetase